MSLVRISALASLLCALQNVLAAPAQTSVQSNDLALAREALRDGLWKFARGHAEKVPGDKALLIVLESYASEGDWAGVKNALGKRGSEADVDAKIIGLVRRAMLGRLPLPCDYSTAERALVLVAGPPAELDRKGVEKSKSWVEENIAGTSTSAAAEASGRKDLEVSSRLSITLTSILHRISSMTRRADARFRQLLTSSISATFSTVTGDFRTARLLQELFSTLTV